MTTGSALHFDDLLRDFSASQLLSELDKAVIEHAIDEWPMGSLAKQNGTTPNALHRREKQLMLAFRVYLLKSVLAII